MSAGLNMSKQQSIGGATRSRSRRNARALVACVLMISVVAPVLTLAAEPDAQDARDSAITAAVETRLEANQVGHLTKLKVDTEQGGTVWLSGTASTQEAAERAVEIARDTDGVMWVKSTIVVAREAK
jgi:osmotically-inducible protein OsmY